MNQRWARRGAGILAGLYCCLCLAGCGKKDKPAADMVQAMPQTEGGAAVSAPAFQPEPLPPAGGNNPFTGRPMEDGVAGQRPVAVMIGNNEGSRPQRGIAAADLVIETLAEGGITRLMAFYGDYRTMPQVGPVRSTRDQFVQFAVPSNAILAHIGSSVYARNLLNVLHYQDVDGFYLGNTAFVYDYERAMPSGAAKLNEYCWFTNKELLWQGMESAQVNVLGEVPSFFHFEEKGAPGTAALEITASFSDVSTTGFSYNAENGLYIKSMNGTPHTDENGKKYRYRNVFLLQCNIGLKEDEVVPDFDLAGGTGIYFNRGHAMSVSWVKGGPDDALHLYYEDGTEVKAQVGKSYIGILPAGRENAVSYAGA